MDIRGEIKSRRLLVRSEHVETLWSLGGLCLLGVMSGIGCTSSSEYALAGLDTLITTASPQLVWSAQYAAYETFGKYSGGKSEDGSDPSYAAKSKKSETVTEGNSYWVERSELQFESVGGNVIQIKEITGTEMSTMLFVTGADQGDVEKILNKIVQELENKV